MNADITAISNAQLDKNIAQLRTKLARQEQSVKDTQAHIQALELLKASPTKTATK